MQASTGLVILAHLLWEGPLFGACPRSLQQCTQFAREQKEKKHALPSPAAPHDGLQELVLGEVAKGGTVLEGGAGGGKGGSPGSFSCFVFGFGDMYSCNDTIL